MTKVLRRFFFAIGGLLLMAGIALVSSETVGSYASFLWGRMHGGYTVSERLAQYGTVVEARLRGGFDAAGLAYPPVELVYAAFKDSRRLEVYGRPAPDMPWVRVLDYPILAASGRPGPKLRRGDNQVPEGIYHAESLNPNSRFHLSIRVNYPNVFDKNMAKTEGRTDLGGDIMIHGNSVSIGCLAMGDEAAEDLFVLAALAIKKRLKIIISPTDFRRPDARAPVVGLPWVGSLYQQLRVELQQYPATK